MKKEKLSKGKQGFSSHYESQTAACDVKCLDKGLSLSYAHVYQTNLFLILKSRRHRHLLNLTDIRAEFIQMCLCRAQSVQSHSAYGAPEFAVDSTFPRDSQKPTSRSLNWAEFII